MTKEIRRLSIVVLVMFFALFAATSWIQVVQVETLADNPHNDRARYDTYEIQRGSIVASGVAIASSVPSDDEYIWQRQYPDPAMWAPITGWMNPALGTATGIEGALNGSLNGTGSSQFISRLNQTISGQPPAGASVELTLDADVQRAAFDALGSLKGAVLAIEPATGRILAMVTSPSFDTNPLASHNPRDAVAAYDALESDPADPLFNRAIGGDLNPPGSTFKLVVVSAALSTGKYTPESTLPNPASYQLPQSTSTVTNASGSTCGPGATVTLADALRLSCNVPMAELAVELGDDVIRAEAEKFGFNYAFEIPLASTASVYPDAPDAPQTALSGFGQGDVLATPLQIALVSAGIANKGVVMAPRMVDTVVAPDLTVQQTFGDSEYQRALDEQVAASMVSMMVANVSNGVAGNARIEGVDVAGKTGTAENGDGEPYTLWFTGFAPAQNPEVAVAVVVEDGGGRGQSGSGGELAAPIAKKVMEAVLNK